MSYPNMTPYPTREITEGLLETHITEELFGEEAIFACLEGHDRNAVESKVFWMLDMMEAVGFFADMLPPKAALSA